MTRRLSPARHLNAAARRSSAVCDTLSVRNIVSIARGRRPGIRNGLCAWLRIDEGDALGESLAFVIVEGHQHLVGFGLQVRAPNAEAEVGRLLVRRGQEFSEDGGGDVLVAQQLLAQAHIDLDGARSLVWSQADDNKLDEAITLSLVDRCGHVGRKSTASSTSLASSVAIASLCRVTVVLGSATRRAVRSAQRGAVPASGSSSCCGGAPRKISTSLTSKAARPSSVFRLNDAGTQPSRVRR